MNTRNDLPPMSANPQDALVEKWQREIGGYLAGMMLPSPVGEMNRASADVARRILADLRCLPTPAQDAQADGLRAVRALKGDVAR